MDSKKTLFQQIPVGNYQNFSYLVADLESKAAAIFDPAWEIQKLISILKEKNLKLEYIVNTHAHMDHIQGNPELSAATGAKIVMSEKSLARKDVGVKDGEDLALGKNVKLHFLLTPGHSPESMCIIVNDEYLITGDTLFIGECGRVDLPGGSASELFESFQKIKRLDPMLLVYPGHDYGSKQFTSLNEQIETNYTLSPMTREEFLKFMNAA